MMTCTKCGAELRSEWSVCPFCGRPVNYTPARRKRGNGQGSAIKRGATWTGIRAGYSYTDPDGKLIRKRPTKGGFKTKKEALLWASGEEAPVILPKMIDLWTGYSTNDMLKLSHDKQAAYKIARKRIESLMNKRVDQITLDEIQSVINETCSTYYPAKDVRDLLSNLYKRAAATNTGAVINNLARFVVLPDTEEKEATPFIPEEVAMIWKLYNSGDIIAGFILLLIYTGMMPIELMRLRKESIDLEALEIRSAGAKTRVRKNAVIVFPPFMKPVIEALMTYDPKSPKLYPVNKDRFYDLYYAALERAQVRKLPPYSCRHTFGTEIVKAGVHPAMVQKMLRHANQKTQEKYTHLTADDQHTTAGQISYGLQVANNETAGH